MNLHLTENEAAATKPFHEFVVLVKLMHLLLNKPDVLLQPGRVYSRRKIESNWEKYEKTETEADESAADYLQLLNATRMYCALVCYLFIELQAGCV